MLLWNTTRQLVLMTQLALLPKPTFWQDIKLRITWAYRALRAPRIHPVIQLGGGVVFDVENRCLHLPADYTIHSPGNLTVSADKHLMFRSGGDEEVDRPGYRHSIWFNTTTDEQGRPLHDQDSRYIHAEVECSEECEHD